VRPDPAPNIDSPAARQTGIHHQRTFNPYCWDLIHMLVLPLLSSCSIASQYLSAALTRKRLGRKSWMLFSLFPTQRTQLDFRLDTAECCQ